MVCGSKEDFRQDTLDEEEEIWTITRTPSSYFQLGSGPSDIGIDIES